VTNKCTIISQIISILHVLTLSCHPQGPCNQYLAKLHNYRIFSNIIRTSFADFLNEKKELVRGSNPHLWEDDDEDKDDSDWVTDRDSVMSDDGESD